jgi:hypothetical protein
MIFREAEQRFLLLFLEKEESQEMKQAIENNILTNGLPKSAVEVADEIPPVDR